jgi:hypothetical protein
MTVTAVNTDGRHVVLVAERHWLLARDARLRYITGTVHRNDHHENAANNKNRAKDAELSKGVGAAVEDL